MTSQTPDDDDAAAATPPRRYVVIVGERANSGSAFRIEDPARLLRVYSLLQAILWQLEGADQSAILFTRCWRHRRSSSAITD
jgi:hypothetical protein